MELSIREAAALLGRSPRTLRAQVARGEIVGVRKGKGWVIKREHLPLTDGQRVALQARAQQVRDEVDEASPSRVVVWSGDRRRRLVDAEAFRLGHEVLSSLDPTSPAAERLRAALLEVAEAWFVYDRMAKLAAIDRARAAVGRAVGHLLLVSPLPPDPVTADRVLGLQDRMASALSDLARQAARMPGRRR